MHPLLSLMASLRRQLVNEWPCSAGDVEGNPVTDVRSTIKLSHAAVLEDWRWMCRMTGLGDGGSPIRHESGSLVQQHEHYAEPSTYDRGRQPAWYPYPLQICVF